MPAPSLPGYGSFLRDVAGSSAADVWAVGEYLDSGIGHTLILHWNGSAWQRVASPDLVTNGQINSTTNELNGVAVIGPNDAWAAGYGVSGNVPYGTLTEHWNGTAWQIVPSPNNATPGFYNALDDVAAISSNDVWAVGGVPKDVGVSGNYVLLMHWNGSAWQLVPQPPETLDLVRHDPLRRRRPGLERRLGGGQVRCLALGRLGLARCAGQRPESAGHRRQRRGAVVGRDGAGRLRRGLLQPTRAQRPVLQWLNLDDHQPCRRLGRRLQCPPSDRGKQRLGSRANGFVGAQREMEWLGVDGSSGCPG